MSDEPFMEHPTGEYATAIDAMEAAISRLRALPEWNRWITFYAQGEGASPEDTHVAEVRLLLDILETGTALDLARITARAKVPRRAIIEAGRTRYSVAAASPREVALLLDALFRHQFGICPFANENNDYAVGAEW